MNAMAAALQDHWWEVELAAADALKELGRSEPEAVAALASAVRSAGSSRGSWEAARALGKLGQAAEPHIRVSRGCLYERQKHDIICLE